MVVYLLFLIFGLLKFLDVAFIIIQEEGYLLRRRVNEFEELRVRPRNLLVETILSHDLSQISHIQTKSISLDE
jgi:hypothetical protein